MKNLDLTLNTLLNEKTVENIAVRVGMRNSVICDRFSSGIDSRTLFDMASVTKILATTSLSLIAISRGLISVDDKVSYFFQTPDAYKELTLKNLLTHTMGIGYKDLTQSNLSNENVQDYILNITPDVPIGSDVLYSCPAFILLGKILEKVFGKALDVAFSEFVATPLSMSATSYRPIHTDNCVNANISPEDKGTVNDYNCRFLGGVAGNAGVFSNISDLTKYVKMLLDFGAPIIDKNVFEISSRNHTENMSESRGLGFLYVDERYSQTGGLFDNGSIGHCGHTGQSLFVDLYSGLYVIILSDATLSVFKKLKEHNYNEVMKMRENIHRAIKLDLLDIDVKKVGN